MIKSISLYDLITEPILYLSLQLEDSLLVDASPEEEACCAAALIVGVSPNKKITTTSIPGHGSFLADPVVFAKVIFGSRVLRMKLVYIFIFRR